MEFLEIPFFDDDIYKLVVRFAINILFLAAMVILAIRPMQREREFAFTAVMMNVMVFFICFSLKKLDIGLGMALGLFAIFGVLRYRTDAIGVKEMTYLFIVIGVAVINSLSNKNTSYAELFLINIAILVSAILKERIVQMSSKSDPKFKENGLTNGNNRDKERKQPKYTVEYDQVQNLGSEYREKLIIDLRQRTGLAISRVEIEHIDLPKQRATLTVWID